MANNERTADSLHGWPIDMLGNEIRKGNLVNVRFPTENVICRVADVRPVSLTDGVNIEGSVFLMVQLPHQGHLPVAVVLKEPEERRIEVMSEMPKPALVKQ